jgi:hypothetical protein
MALEPSRTASRIIANWEIHMDAFAVYQDLVIIFGAI